MAEQAAAAHNQNSNGFAYSDAEIDRYVMQLKLIAGLSPSPLERQRCLECILKLRSQQLQSAMFEGRPLFPPNSYESAFEADVVPHALQAAGGRAL